MQVDSLTALRWRLQSCTTAKGICHHLYSRSQKLGRPVLVTRGSDASVFDRLERLATSAISKRCGNRTSVGQPAQSTYRTLRYNRRCVWSVVLLALAR